MSLGLTAAVLFDIVLGAFTQWQTVCGKLVGAFGTVSYLDLLDSLLLVSSVGRGTQISRQQ